MLERHVDTSGFRAVSTAALIESCRFVQLAKWRWGLAVRLGYVDLGTICPAIEGVHDGARGSPEGNREQPIRSFGFADVKGGDSALFYTTVSRAGAPKWRSPAATLGIDEMDITVKFHGRAFNVERNCARRKVEPKDVGELG